MRRMISDVMQRQIKNLFESVKTDENDNVEIGKNLAVNGKLYLNNLSKLVDKTGTPLVKQKFRHTVVLKLYGGGTNPMAAVSFTDYSDRETPITDYSKLHFVFGGKIISVNGLVSVYANSEWQTAAPCTLDLTGGTMATDKLNFVYAVSTIPIPKTLAELGASTFTVEDTVSEM